MCFISTDRRPLMLAAVARGVSWLGDEVALVALLLRLQPAGVGAVTALLVCGLVPVVVLAGVAGRLVDRHDTRSLLTWSSSAQAVVCTVLAFTPSTWAILTLVTVLGAGQALNGAAWTATVPALAIDGDLARGVSWMQAGVTVGSIVAPGVGGLLTGLTGSTTPLMIDAASFVVVLVIGLLLPPMRRPAPSPGGATRGGPALVRGDSVLMTLFALVGAFVLVGATVNVVEVFLVRDVLRASATWFGVCGSTYAVGALVGTLVAGRWSGTRAVVRAFLVSAAVLGVGLVGMGLSPAVGWLLACGVVAGFGQGVMNVAIKTLVLVRSAADTVGRVSALLNGIVSATQLLAFLAGGLLAGVVGARMVFVLGGALALFVPVALARHLLRAAAGPGTADLASMTPSAPASA